MSEYKCICCGETRDSDKKISCPNCGYAMFAVPYDRRSVLVSEIRRFISGLELNGIEKGDLIFFRPVKGGKGGAVLKSEDEKRFPGFEKIRDHVASAEKSEEFIGRLVNSVQQLRGHLHTTFTQEYVSKNEPLKERLSGLDTTLKKALDTLGVSAEIKEVQLPEITLKYSEEPDGELISKADTLLDGIEKFIAVIRKFIKQNNIYGSAHRQKPEINTEFYGKSGADILDAYTEKISKAVDKKYIVDLFSDGTEELEEMLKLLWEAFFAVMKAGVLAPENLYFFRTAVRREMTAFRKSCSVLSANVIKMLTHLFPTTASFRTKLKTSFLIFMTG